MQIILCVQHKKSTLTAFYALLHTQHTEVVVLLFLLFLRLDTSITFQQYAICALDIFVDGIILLKWGICPEQRNFISPWPPPHFKRRIIIFDLPSNLKSTEKWGSKHRNGCLMLQYHKCSRDNMKVVF